MKNITLRTLYIIIFLQSISCNFNATYLDEESEKKKAEIVVDKFYDYIKNSEFKNTENLFSSKFYKITSKAVLNQIYLKTKNDLGTFKSKRLIDWKTRRIEGSKPSLDVFLKYEVEYEYFKAIETINLIMEENEIKILSYNINSEGFLSIKK
jgi:hypothetical protein